MAKRMRSNFINRFIKDVFFGILFLICFFDLDKFLSADLKNIFEKYKLISLVLIKKNH